MSRLADLAFDPKSAGNQLAVCVAQYRGTVFPDLRPGDQIMQGIDPHRGGDHPGEMSVGVPVRTGEGNDPDSGNASQQGFRDDQPLPRAAPVFGKESTIGVGGRRAAVRPRAGRGDL